MPVAPIVTKPPAPPKRFVVSDVSRRAGSRKCPLRATIESLPIGGALRVALGVDCASHNSLSVMVKDCGGRAGGYSVEQVGERAAIVRRRAM